MKVNVVIQRDGKPAHKLCRLAPGELFFSAGRSGVIILCFNKALDNDMVRQIKAMLEPLPNQMNPIMNIARKELPKSTQIFSVEIKEPLPPTQIA